MIGLCECGCGFKAPIAKKTDTSRGYVAGKPRRFIQGHHQKREKSPRWNGGSVVRNGYRLIHCPNHPRRDPGGYVLEHVLVAEAALGRRLPENAVVHHVNSDRSDNRPANLVVCEDQRFHMLLHARERAYLDCGHADWLKCSFCKRYDRPERISGSRRMHYHRLCRSDYRRRRYAMGMSS